MSEWITPLWGFLATVGMLVWIHRTDRHHRARQAHLIRLIEVYELDLLPVCACGQPDTPGAHGPDMCDLGTFTK